MRWSVVEILSVCVAAVMIGGCVNQKAEVAQYRKVLDGPDAKAALPSAATQPGVLPLEDALRMANADNEQLAISGEDYVQALISKTRAAETFLPSISFAPTMTRQEQFAYPNFGGTPSSSNAFSNFYPQNYSDLPVNTQLKTSLVRDLYDVSRAAKTVEQRKALLLDLQSTILLNVGQTYYGILESEQSVRTLTTSVAVQEARVKNVRNRFLQGVARRLDVAQSEADAAATRVQLTDARNNVTKGRATLAHLLGRESVEEGLVDHFTPPETTEDVPGLLHLARQHRQDLVAAAQAVNASAAAVRSAWGEYAPTISVNLNTFLYRESFPSDSWWNALFSLNLPIFEEGIIHNDVRDAYSRLRQAVSRAMEADHQVNEDVRDAYSDYQASLQRLRDLRTEAEAATRAYDASTHAFVAGTATNLDVLTAQDSQLSSQLKLETETYNRKVAYLNLLRVTGRLNREAIAMLATMQMNHAAPSTMPAATKMPHTFRTTTTTTVTTTTTTTTTDAPAGEMLPENNP
jgi:outer membrane protein TolC